VEPVQRQDVSAQLASSESPELVVHPSWGRRLIGIEGLRGTAALSVLFHHVGQHLTNSGRTGLLGHATVLATHGLTLFFALSGFLLVRPFAAAILAGDRLPSIGGYAREIDSCESIRPTWPSLLSFLSSPVPLTPRDPESWRGTRRSAT
jgi:hypothetical protein